MLAGALGAAVAATDERTADDAFGAFRADLVDALVETRARLMAGSGWVDDPDWYLVQTPDSGVVGVRRSRLADHALLMADPDFRARFELLGDPVHAWDEEFTMALALIDEEARRDGDVMAAADRLATSLSQDAAEKKAMLRPERQALRADRDELIAAIDAYDGAMTGLGIQPAMIAAADIQPEPEPRLEQPIDLLIAFRDKLVADLAVVQSRISACREAIDRVEVVALGEAQGLAGVTTYELLTLPDYAEFFEYLREHPEVWPVFDPAAADFTSLRGALYRFQLWQDWPPGKMRANAERFKLYDVPTEKEDRAVCRPLLEVLRPERDRLDAAITALDEYLVLTASEVEATPTPSPTPEPVAFPDEATPTPSPASEVEATPAPNPFADL